MGHTFIILGDDIYTLDTVAERSVAAEHMRDAGVERLSVYRGGPDGNQVPEGRDFGNDGQFHSDGKTHGSLIGDVEAFRNQWED